jgi:hypothetical protein
MPCAASAPALFWLAADAFRTLASNSSLAARISRQAISST